jgi:rhodanese-related sulfurtransferase
MQSIRTRSSHLLGVVAASLIAVAAAGWGTGGAAALAQGLTIFQTTLMEPNQKTAEVSTDELRQILKDGSATVVDARPPMEYATSHIPGALNVAPKAGVPMSVYVSDAAEVGRLVSDKAAPIVLYCNGPFCGKSKRLGEELLEAGYSNVRRYQLGAPTWRALVGVMQIEMDGVRYVRDGDRTAVWIDARSHEEYQAGSLPGARNIPAAEVVAAKDDGRLPIEDHNTRIIVFGTDAEQARAATTEIAKNAFHNASFFAGTLDDLVAGLGESPVVAAR